MSFETLVAEYGPVVEAVAADGGRRFHRFGADADDFRQELHLWLWQKAEWLEERRAEIDDDDQFEKFLARCLRNEVADYGLDIRAQAGGQDRETACWYTRGELEYLLGLVWDPEAWTEPPVPEGGGRRAHDPATGGNWIATLADVARALGKIPPEKRDVIEQYWRLGIPDDGEAGRSRRRRAVDHLHRILGGEKPRHMREAGRDPWRGRHAVDSAAARAAVVRAWDGE